MGRSGVATQAIAAIDIALYDLKAKRPTCRWPNCSVPTGIRCRPTTPPADSCTRRWNRSTRRAANPWTQGIGGIKIKVGQPDYRIDLDRVAAVREHLGADVPFMVDANQQWDRPTAMRVGRALEQFNLVWIEEPLDAYDAQGHAQLAAALDTSIATGEMLSSVGEHVALIEHKSVDIIQPDAPRIGGITPFLRLATLADQAGLQLGAALRDGDSPASRGLLPAGAVGGALRVAQSAVQRATGNQGGRMIVPNRPGLGFTLSDQAFAWRDNRRVRSLRPQTAERCS